MRYLVRDRDADLAAPLGGKARALAALRDAGVTIPPWFVVLPSAFDGESLAGPVLDELCGLLPELGGLVAVRSSASDEDGARHSFAGQLESYLSVAPQDVPARIVDVWRSAFSERV